jgi:hypothetical protein
MVVMPAVLWVTTALGTRSFSDLLLSPLCLSFSPVTRSFQTSFSPLSVSRALCLLLHIHICSFLFSTCFVSPLLPFGILGLGEGVGVNTRVQHFYIKCLLVLSAAHLALNARALAPVFTHALSPMLADLARARQALLSASLLPRLPSCVLSYTYSCIVPGSRNSPMESAIYPNMIDDGAHNILRLDNIFTAYKLRSY